MIFRQPPSWPLKQICHSSGALERVGARVCCLWRLHVLSAACLPCLRCVTRAQMPRQLCSLRLQPPLSHQVSIGLVIFIYKYIINKLCNHTSNVTCHTSHVTHYGKHVSILHVSILRSLLKCWRAVLMVWGLGFGVGGLGFWVWEKSYNGRWQLQRLWGGGGCWWHGGVVENGLTDDKCII